MIRYSIIRDERDGWVLLEIVEEVRELGRYKTELEAVAARCRRIADAEEEP
jgi:hypothetical protein